MCFRIKTTIINLHFMAVHFSKEQSQHLLALFPRQFSQINNSTNTTRQTTSTGSIREQKSVPFFRFPEVREYGIGAVLQLAKRADFWVFRASGVRLNHSLVVSHFRITTVLAPFLRVCDEKNVFLPRNYRREYFWHAEPTRSTNDYQ